MDALDGFITEHEKTIAWGKTRKESCLSVWYPLIESVVPTPKTVFIETNVDFFAFWDQKRPAGFDDFLVQYRQAIESLGTMPMFLRTGITSAKHEWKDTCFLTDIKNLESHVARIYCFSSMADIVGLPCDVWVAREMLPTRPVFFAFDEMPIVRERRLFVRDGHIVCNHPYWPADAFTPDYVDKPPDWESHIPALQTLDEDEAAMLEHWTCEVGKRVPGFWSVDWLETANGWYLTDMGRGDQSFHWPDCEIATRPDRSPHEGEPQN